MMVTPWQQLATTIVMVLSVVVLCVVLYVAAESRSQGDVLDRVDEVTAAQQESDRSTECAREVTGAGEVAQLETLATLQDGLLDLVESGGVTESTEANVRSLDALLDEAISGYENLNDLCPVPGSEDHGDPNEP